MADIAADKVYCNWFSILLFTLLVAVRLMPNNLLEVHDLVIVNATRNILYQPKRWNYNFRTSKLNLRGLKRQGK